MIVTKDFANFDGVFKLHGDPDPAGLMGRVLKRADVRTDLGRMCATITLTKEIEDRSGDIVVVKGIDLADHRLHPVALFNHDKDAPIGRFEDPTGHYTVRQQGDSLTGDLYFNQKSAFAQDVFECVVDKTFTAASIGFLPVLGAIEKRHPRGTFYGKSRLVEGSIVTVGDNPHAGVQAIHKALGRAGASEVFKQYLSPLVPKRPATVTSGWESKAMSGFDKDPTDPTAAPADEFAPPDPNADPTAVDPTMQQDPHADHKAVADDAAGNTAASIFEKFTSGQLDRKAAMKLFDKILRHHEDIADLGGGDDDGDMDAEDDEDEDDEEGFDDADSFDDEGEDDEDDDGPPDLADKSKKRAEKAVAHIWHGTYEPVMSDVFAAIGHVVREKDLDPEKAQAYLRKQMRRMQKLPSVLGMVKKALADADSAWDEWNEAFFRRNGTH
jgi:HK97 family phage prohead protease